MVPPIPTLLPFLIKGGLHTYDFLSKMFKTPGPSNDPFIQLFSPTGHHDISAFVVAHYEFTKSSSNPVWSLRSRFPVTTIAINKANMPLQHESFALWGSDLDRSTAVEFVIDRVSSFHYASRFTTFSQFRDSNRVITSIKRAMGGAGSHVAFSMTKTKTKIEIETVPLLPSTPDSSLTSIAQISFADKFTSSLAQAVAVARSGSYSISPPSLALDSIRGHPEQSIRPADCICTFKPLGLTVFDVVLIAKVVHDYTPMYGLFDNHCYMFACILFDVIVQLFSLPSTCDHGHASTSSGNPPVPAPTREVNVPENANIVMVPLPDQAGRWAGLLILDPIVKATIVFIVIEQFRVEHALYVF